MRVFWAWQSDLDAKVCRHFIKAALQQALKELSTESELSERPEIDHDTKDVAGIPDIVATIFKKIESASAFVADLTTIARTDADKAVANPNVLLELGYAKKAISTERIVGVANTHWYKGPTDLPFDLRHRRGPIEYELPPNADAEKKHQAKNALVADLKTALRPILAKSTTELTPIVRRTSRDGDPSIWLQKGDQIQHQGWRGDGTQKITPLEAPRAYVRIGAQGWTQSPPTRATLREIVGGSNFLPHAMTDSGDGGLNAEGFVQYWFRRQADLTIAWSATQFFLDSVEVWSYAAPVNSPSDDRDYLAVHKVLDSWRDHVLKGVALLGAMSARAPFDVEVGVVRLEHLRWPDRHHSVLPVLERVRHKESHAIWDAKCVASFLDKARREIADAYGLDETVLPPP